MLQVVGGEPPLLAMPKVVLPLRLNGQAGAGSGAAAGACGQPAGAAVAGG